MITYFKHRLLFGYGGLGVGIVIFILGISGLFVVDHVAEYFVPILFILLSVLLSTSKVGAALDSENNEVFKFFQILGLKIPAKRTSISAFSCLLILKYNITWINYSRANHSSHDERGYCITLANTNHKKKYTLAILQDKTSIQEQANKISQILNFPIETYNPPQSSRRR